jgi:hypothetical protein
MGRQLSILVPLYAAINAVPILRGLVPENYNCNIHCEKLPAKDSHIFVTVHGTWATGANWTRPSSALFDSIRKEWPESGFYRFNWSGVNGARHRLMASRELTTALNNLSASHPTSRIVVISHSHGGNVVAWASTKVAHSLFAAIYLNTPFIQVIDPKRSTGFVLRFFLWVGGMILMSPIAVFWPVSLGGFLGALLIILFLLFSLQKIIPPKVQRIGEALADVSTARRQIFRELVVNATGDEAASMFGGIYATQWLIKRLLAYLFLFAIVCVICAGVLPEDSFMNSIVGPITLLSIIALLFLSLLISTGAYGFQQGLVALNVPVSVTPTPIGQVDATTVAWTDEDKLRHSMLYQSEEVFVCIKEWLRPILL